MQAPEILTGWQAGLPSPWYSKVRRPDAAVRSPRASGLRWVAVKAGQGLWVVSTAFGCVVPVQRASGLSGWTVVGW